MISKYIDIFFIIIIAQWVKQVVKSLFFFVGDVHSSPTKKLFLEIQCLFSPFSRTNIILHSGKKYLLFNNK